MKSIHRATSCLGLLATASLLLLPGQAVGAEPQSPASVTCLNLILTPEGPRHQYLICTARGCFTTRPIPGSCPVA